MTPCSQQSAQVGEPLAGTAPLARSWVIVEQPGPWGRDAIVDSQLPEPVRDSLVRLKAAGVGVLLTRHADRIGRVETDGRHVWVARTASGGMRLRRAVLDDLGPLTSWDPAALAAGELPAIGTSTTAPLLLVCTHSRRDACCALHGRALAAGLLAELPAEQRDRVWECSHVGGHRFAPVALALPSGTVHGRLAVDEGAELLALTEFGRVRPDRMRGRTCFVPPLQAADVAVRRAEGVDGCDDLDVLAVPDGRPVPVDLGWTPPGDDVEAEVRHVDGRAWRVAVQRTTLSADRAESCGGEPAPVHAWRADIPRPVTPWR